MDDAIVAAVNNLAHITKDTMGELIKELAGEEKLSVTQDMILKALDGIQELTKDEQVVLLNYCLTTTKIWHCSNN